MNDNVIIRANGVQKHFSSRVSGKIKALDVAPIFARAIAHVHGGTSIADLF